MPSLYRRSSHVALRPAANRRRWKERAGGLASRAETLHRTAASPGPFVLSSRQAWRQSVQVDHNHLCPGIPRNTVHYVAEPCTMLYGPSKRDCSIDDFLSSELGGIAKLGRFPGIQMSWPADYNVPLSGHWPPSDIDVSTPVFQLRTRQLTPRSELHRRCPEAPDPASWSRQLSLHAYVALLTQSLNVAPQVQPVIKPSSLLECLVDSKVSSRRSFVDLGQHISHLAARKNYLIRLGFSVSWLPVVLQHAVPYC
jgi:hypothetical protein